jgi:predicted RecA/RadA family phage recombinase
MNTNYAPGKIMTYTAPAGGVASGTAYLIGALLVVAAIDADAAASFTGQTEGVHTLPKTANEGAWVEGQPLYWDAANGKLSIDPTKGLPVATVAEAALTAATEGRARLHGLSAAGRPITVRKRFSIAQINAGATLVPAVPGLKARMIDALAIAVGGAAGAVTTVDILGTQTTSKKLVAFAQANLTQSTVLRAGGTGAAVLADGASFAPNDVNTAITVGKTGADVTTATDIDVQLTYTLEP